MAITAITIENFKGIREPVRVELKPITLLFGPNSAGKSTIVQALHYAREIFERQNLNPDRTLLGGDSIDLGGFESLVHGHDLTLPVTLRFDLDLSDEDLPRYLEGYEDFGLMRWQESDLWDIPENVNSAWVEVTVRWSDLRGQPLLSSYRVGINGEDLATLEGTGDGRQVNLSKIELFNPVFLEDVSPDEARKNFAKFLSGENLEDLDAGLEYIAKMKIASPLFGFLKGDGELAGITKGIALAGQKSAMPEWGRTLKLDRAMWNEETTFEEEGNFIQLISSLITGPGELVRDALRKLCYVGPLRVVPKRGHRPSTSPEESRWANGLAAYDTLFFSDDAFIGKVNTWLTREERLASGYSVEVKKYRELEADNPLILAMLQGRILDEEADLRDTLLAIPIKRRLLIRDEARDIELAPQDIGVGISQVLPVVVAALHQKTGLVAIEQPELHIHPAFQVALGDLFIEQVRERPDLTFILETHSEHLMLRFLRRIRETGENEAPANRTLTPPELSIYFIEQGEAGISCSAIRVDESGDFIDRWPHGFFEEREEELFG
jgi:hypothetical protein